MNWSRLAEIVTMMAILVVDAIAGSVILGADTPNLYTCFQILPYDSWHLMFPTEEIDAVTLTDAA